MQLTVHFPDRPRLEMALRIFCVIAVLVLAAAAVAERDGRQGAAVVVMACFFGGQILVLSERVGRILFIVAMMGFAVWLALVVF